MVALDGAFCDEGGCFCGCWVGWTWVGGVVGIAAVEGLRGENVRHDVFELAVFVAGAGEGGGLVFPFGEEAYLRGGFRGGCRGGVVEVRGEGWERVDRGWVGVEEGVPGEFGEGFRERDGQCVGV